MASHVAPIELVAEREIGVDPLAIEAEFKRIWAETLSGSEEGATLLLRVLNLVALGRSDDDVVRFEHVMQALPQRHPCRALLAHTSPGTTLDATLSAQCWRPGGGRRHVCSEQVLLTGSPDHERELASAVLALLVPELPVVVWLLGAPETAGYLAGEVLDHADRVVVDSASATGRDGLVVAMRIADLYGITPADLAWERLTAWRDVAAQFFDGPDGARELELIRSITVRGRAAEASLLAGWLVSRLDLALADANRTPDAIDATYYDGTRGVHVHVELDGAPPVEALRIETADAQFSVECHAASGHLHVRETWETGETRRTVAQPPGGDADLVAVALDGTQDPGVYRDAAHAALAMM